MTREQAIAILEDNKPSIIFEDEKLQKESADISIALNMAISALEQEPTDDATLKDIFCMGCEYKEQEPCDDVISRDEVIDILHHAWESRMYIPECIREVKELPSVQPKPIECDDAISRTDAIAEIYDKYMTVDGGLHNDTAKGCIGVIKELPSVQPSRKGHWIKDEPTVTAPYVCSECGMFHNGKNRNFCPYCGAKME